MSNPHRLRILCELHGGELTVGDLQHRIGISQSNLSQQLARLREAKLVTTRRESQKIFYTLASEEVVQVIHVRMDWKEIVSTVAPGLATALGGPMAGVAVRGIASALLGAEDAGQTDVEQAILRASPTDLRKLKQAELEFRQHMKELEIDLQALHAADRESARSRQVQTGDQMPAFIAFAALGGFFGILAAMIFVDLPSGSEAPLNVMLGALGSLVVAIGNYYFGSSAGSSAKNALIENLLSSHNFQPPGK
eukprot:s1_g1074.t1